MSDCPRAGRLFGRCKFSPRYELGAATAGPKVSGMSEDAILAIVECYRPQTYVRDVCERCGKTVERQS